MAKSDWQGEGWYRVGWSDGGKDWTSNGPRWYGSEHELKDELFVAGQYETDTHLLLVEYMGDDEVVMRTAMAFAMGEAHRNDPLMVFDWDKAARILVGRNPDEALAGLQDDYEYTAGVIWRNGRPVMDDYTYLASTWAHPMLIIGDEEIECWRYKADVPTWSAETKWPESAIDIVKKASESKEQ